MCGRRDFVLQYIYQNRKDEKNMSAVKLTSANYDAEVTSSQVPVLIDFWATWCGPCRMMTPVVEEIADEAEGKYKVCSVNVDEEPELSVKFGVSAIPTFVAVKNGEIAGRTVGVSEKEELLALLA